MKLLPLIKKETTVANLEEYKIETKIDDTELFSNVVGQDSLTRFDAPKSSNRRKEEEKTQF